MELIPALDLRKGRCVRLSQGDPDRETCYETDPSKIVADFIAYGASKLHLINLDGAFGEGSVNPAVIKGLLREYDINVELGGGIRTLEDIDFWLNKGVSQVILGTSAIEAPELVSQAIKKFGNDAIIVGMDVKDGRVTVRGWREDSFLSPEAFSRDMENRGVTRFIFTAVETDGMLCGPAKDALSRFARGVTAKVTASGGVSSVEDILGLIDLESDGVDSVIAGRAIYEGRLDLKEAFQVLYDLNKAET
ncbi:MAG: 1-(5-phosphoribosyl)-5-[(5-phosphoribosylamino)methylideneamino]imidazole-4-carboxamide isomerase [Deltaproteobacteria bacterium]|nr:1-(5-phosphoribosyl)-5-[(5-phosphoribosylamino)methylideneamino]imidazole-4-carboxamide isomerase [Deltaproteobacteria bacterium]